MTIEDEIKNKTRQNITHDHPSMSDHKEKEEKKLPNKHLKIIVLSFVNTKKIQIMKSESV